MDSTASWREILKDNFESLKTAIEAYLPNLVGAALLIVLGITLALVVRWLILRLGHSMDILGQKLGLSRYYLNTRWPPSRVLAGTVYWFILIFFFTTAAKVLELPGIDKLIQQLIASLPDIFIAIIIIWAGFILGAIAKEWISSGLKKMGIQHFQAFGNSTRMLIIILTIVVSLRQLGVNVQLIEEVLVVFLTAIVFGLSLSFGLGAGSVVSNIIVINQLKKIYLKGQRVRVDNLEGQIIEFSKSAVILDTDSGRAMIPARTFQEKSSVLLDEEEIQ